MDCELCKAINETDRIIFETELSFCIIPKWPLKTGHVMVLPKRHVVDWSELNKEEAKDLIDLIDKMKFTLLKGFEEDCLILNHAGKLRSQQHLHAHIVPSKKAMRDFFLLTENIPKYEDVPEKVMIEMCEHVKKLL
ncbi:HIT family protein [archaeon]|nr:HIT family protein [archaeon]MBL7056853.1 HIT family protein [Candidatus Woesearchaeota archaeon]